MNGVGGDGMVGFDLHGLVSVGLVDASPSDVRTVERQLGPLRARLAGEPDITLRFVDRIRPKGPIRYLGLDEGGFTDEGFLLLRAKGKARTRVRIPLDQVGGRCEIVCERGLPAVPLLIAIVNLTALSKGTLPLHAAAFDWQGTGVVVTGWSKGGKTETLLSFMLRGARYVADEWCYVAPDGCRIFGVPEPVRLWQWQLRQLPELRRHVPLASRARLAALAAPSRLHDRLPPALERSAAGRSLRRVAHFLSRQTNVLVPPEALFQHEVGPAEGEFSHLLLVMSAEGPRTEAVAVDPQEVADRMVHSLEYERIPFLEIYRMFRFAFPGLSNPHVEKAEERCRTLLRQAFAGKPAHRVVHPYPVDIRGLFDVIEPVLS